MKGVSNIKKIIALILCAISIFSLVACSAKPVEEKYVDTLEEAQKIIGFNIDIPKNVISSGSQTYYVSGRTLEITYFNGKVISGRIIKTENKEEFNFSYYDLSNEQKIKSDNIEYTLYGPEADSINLATWTNKKYSYILSIMNTMTTEEIIDICTNIK